MPKPKTELTILQSLVSHARRGETGLALGALADWAEVRLAALAPRAVPPSVPPSVPAGKVANPDGK
jgi:hypothetical protein